MGDGYLADEILKYQQDVAGVVEAILHTAPFDVLRAADAVYRLLSVEGLRVKEMPSLRQLVDSRLGYYIREGKHSMTADDWRMFLAYGDHWMK